MNIKNFEIPKIENWGQEREELVPEYQNPRTKKINKHNQKLFDNSTRLENMYREYMENYEKTILGYMSEMQKATMEQDLDKFKVLSKEAQRYIRCDTDDYFERLARYLQPRIKSLPIDKPYRDILGKLKRNLHRLLWVEKELHLYFDCVEAPRKRKPNLNWYFG